MPVTRTTIRFTRESMDLIREAAKRQDSSAVLPSAHARPFDLDHRESGRKPPRPLRTLEARTRGSGSRALKHGEVAADRRRGRGVGERGEHEERSTRRRLERVVRACAGANQTRVSS